MRRADMHAQPLTIVTAADAAYALPLAVTLRSAIDHLGRNRDLELFVIDDGLGGELRDKVECSLDGAIVHWIDALPSPPSGLPLWGRMPATTYQRLNIPTILPDGTDRAIWLDADLVVLADLGELWEVSMGGNSVLAVPDPHIVTVSDKLGLAGWKEMGLADDAPYFNAGVMLVDVDRWRRHRVMEQAYDYLQRFHAGVVFHDQEALNAVLAGAWGRLDDRWNRSANEEGRRHKDGSAPPAILHYLGPLKPWVDRAHSRWHTLYHEQIDRTAWRGWRPDASLSADLRDLYHRSTIKRLIQPLEQRYFLRLVERTRHSAQ